MRCALKPTLKALRTNRKPKAEKRRCGPKPKTVGTVSGAHCTPELYYALRTKIWQDRAPIAILFNYFWHEIVGTMKSAECILVLPGATENFGMYFGN